MNVYDNTAMLNAYPDSLGGNLSDIVCFLKRAELKDVFKSFYILPSLFNSDLDRGFSVIDYGLNSDLASIGDLDALRLLGIDLKLDFILNHASAQSKEFQDILDNGEQSEFRDYFIDWNKFWNGYGEMTEDGYIKPYDKYIANMFFRKPGLPILSVRFPDGRDIPYWNTFYSKIRQKGERPEYFGQMDLNIKSPLVWHHYEQTLQKLAEYGAKIVRLDAFAYASKEPGERNFLNDPGTWDMLERIREIADAQNLTLLPEIHAAYADKTHELLSQKGYMIYDFFLPGLIIDAIERSNSGKLKQWADELVEKDIRAVNMLGCHDGIPVLDLKGLISDTHIQALIDTIVQRGGLIKNLHGRKDIYYQVNSTYYSALGENDKKLLLARAIQLFMPGKSQIWYLDLFAGKNNYAAVSGVSGGRVADTTDRHKEINRTNFDLADIDAAIDKQVTVEQLKMLRFRNTFPAFTDGSITDIYSSGEALSIHWQGGDHSAQLTADLAGCIFSIVGYDPAGNSLFHMDNT